MNSSPFQPGGIQGVECALNGPEPEIVRTMAEARGAQGRWAETPIRERLRLLGKLRCDLAEHAVALSEASAAARHRPWSEVLTAEVLPLAEACRFLEREGSALLAPRRVGARGRPLWLAGITSEIHREPCGVILIIAPGNYPLLLPGVQLIQALAAGNAVLLKPGTGGTAVIRLLMEMIHRSGIDPHLVRLLPESTEAAQAAIAACPDKILFTGSAAVGERILAQAAPLLIPAAMELSGSDAVLVRADADLELTTKALVFGLTLNAGATCMAPKRVFVHRSVATELEGRLSEAFRHPPPRGQSGLTREVLSRTGVQDLRRLFSEAMTLGAHFIADGFPASGSVPTPVVLGGVHPKSLLLREEVFTSVLALVTVTDDDEAVAYANDCPYALGASIFTRDEMKARGLASRLQAGVVTINDVIIPTADARLPFGGRKRSGFGVTRGAEGLIELTVPKVVTVSRSRFRPAFAPSHPSDNAICFAYLKLVHGSGLRARGTALWQMLRAMMRRK